MIAHSSATTSNLSLEEVHASVPLPKSGWRRLLAFAGPAFLISVGYMDPGNWGTDIQAGSSFGYRLLWVLLMSNLMAVLLQSLATRLGVVTGRDLAQACRENYPRRTAVGLWVLCEIAIAACDLAEVIGTIIALKLLFGLPYIWGLAVAAADTFLLLALQRHGMRLLELLTLALIGVIGVCFFVEIVWANPEWTGVLRGFVPGLMPGAVTKSLYVAIGMLGATVMPHNLYLHSALVQTRAFRQTPEGKREALKYNLIDSVVALNGAFLVNAAILILAAATFAGQEVEKLQDAHRLLPQVLGTSAAAALFAVALLASGQSSTFTGTLAGQVVMEGFVRFRLRPWARRLLTRAVAIVPALLVIALAGQESATPPPAPTEAVAATDSAGGEAAAEAPAEEASPVDKRLFDLLVLSQVVLSFQLPFAIVPLVHFTSNRRRMGEFAVQGWLKYLAWASGGIVVAMNAILIPLTMETWVEEKGWSRLAVYGTVVPVAVVIAAFLAWVTVYPLLRRRDETEGPLAEPVLAPVRYAKIGVAVELLGADDDLLAQAVAMARSHNAELIVVHIVEGPGALLYGAAVDDQESREDRRRMAELVEHLRGKGLPAQGVLGYGMPPEELTRIATERGFDLLVMGAHGHRLLADLALGQTVSPVLHRLTIPILVVPTRPRTR